MSILPIIVNVVKIENIEFYMVIIKILEPDPGKSDSRGDGLVKINIEIITIGFGIMLSGDDKNGNRNE